MSELIQANEPRCLADSFKSVDPAVYEYAVAGLSLLEHFLDSERLVLYDVNGKGLFSLVEWKAAAYAGTWPAVRPFDSGSQFADWQASNCARCVREENADRDEPPTCPILYALSLACLGSGYVTAEIADRAGWEAGAGRYVWQCGEVEWTESWKAEVLARQNGKEVAREVWTIRLG
jgi:hypothetical protein